MAIVLCMIKADHNLRFPPRFLRNYTELSADNDALQLGSLDHSRSLDSMRSKNLANEV